MTLAGTRVDACDPGRTKGKAQVKAFYEAALEGGTDNGAPGPRDHAPGYYACFVHDSGEQQHRGPACRAVADGGGAAGCAAAHASAGRNRACTGCGIVGKP